MSKVALTEVDVDAQVAVHQALSLVGRLDKARIRETPVVVKVGVFNHKARRTNYPTAEVVGGITSAFNQAEKIYLIESDNYKGPGSERLQVWKELFSQKIVPFNLSEDKDTRQVEIAGEKMELSNLLFRPKIFVSTHALRRYARGTILKNLFGLIPIRKKAVYHTKLVPVILDLFEAIGGVDLAVIDATRTYSGPSARRSKEVNVIIAGKDAVAVETVGAALIGPNPAKMPIIQEAAKRGLGEGNLDNIKILGTPIEDLKERFRDL
ncbi:MAG: DUF362 domain-containing protein [Candidatus Bathyarchaeota archaeon]|nr:MAG: DUF362 domain-containing protein [Candidatus Bathyarchaeota archaeon]